MRNAFFKYSNRILPIIIFSTLIFISGCKKELYTGLSEQDANEILAVLLESKIESSKYPSSDGKTWSLDVEDSNLVRAVQVLREHGLPRNKFNNLGDLFRKDGLISTPTEERIRFIYGTSQELSDTLSKIDGVLVARVQIVLPNNDPLAQSIKPSSAAVFIKYRPGADVRAWIPQIKTLVMHSVEGLTYDQVSVIAMPADLVDTSTNAVSAPAADHNVWLHRTLIAILVIGLIVALVVIQRSLTANLRQTAGSDARMPFSMPGRSQEPASGTVSKKWWNDGFSSLVERIRKIRSR
ncbi:MULTISPECIES: type III secretion system inner membrane ring lipoprotein SctJ [Burkholderia]|uniref:Lipoprotein n=1 Tax=Burkholderia singularis TaxID=1503053 RepID=A0A238H423_9BURK|nr:MULTISPECIES: type III secretion inner membrane ring lipoprotein SctJ [Burkholderia]SMF99968.1 Type III secretion bridge between inner and outermembrane lipoprotein (YscJ,HrcJ,EscJ, PscJ) [Burkholderia singularis]